MKIIHPDFRYILGRRILRMECELTIGYQWRRFWIVLPKKRWRRYCGLVIGWGNNRRPRRLWLWGRA